MNTKLCARVAGVFLVLVLAACGSPQPTLMVGPIGDVSGAELAPDAVGDAAAITPTDQDAAADGLGGETADSQVESDGADASEPPDAGTDVVPPPDTADTDPSDAAAPDGTELLDATPDGLDGSEPDTAGGDAAADLFVPDAVGSDTSVADTAATDTAATDSFTDTSADGGSPDVPGCKLAGDCDDGNGCTTDLCKADGTCAHSPLAGCVPPLKPCDSQNKCASGVCNSATNACV